MTISSIDDLPTASAALATLLEHENRLLEALDLAAAAALLPAKQGATAAFLRAQVHNKASPAGHAAMTGLGARLRILAAENRRLLERGLAAQGRVIAVIARAVRAHPPTAPRYGASGALAGPRTPAPLAISARM